MPADADATTRADVTIASGVQVVDSPLTRVHRLTDLISMIVTVIGITLTLLIAAYAQHTAAGVTEDIQGISDFVQRLLVAPVNILSGIITIVIPGYIIISLALRKEPRRILEVIGASVIGFAITGLAVLLLLHFASEPLLASLSVQNPDGSTSLQLPAYITAVAAMVTASGSRLGNRTTSLSWTLLWVGAALGVVTGIVTAPAAILTILMGRLVGLGMRYAVGSNADRAYGDALVDGIVRAGFTPRKIVRADATKDYTPEALDGVTAALAHSRGGRVYAVTTTQNHHLIAVAVDGDQHAAGFVSKLWSTLRLRGINARADVSLRQSAERTALVSYAARTAGVRTSRVLGMAAARDTIVTLYQRPQAALSFGDTPAEEVSDTLLDSLWTETERAHIANISHRNISSETVLVSDVKDGEDPTVWLTTWELGETAASEIAIRIDRAQVLAMIATKVGVERAVASAFRCLTTEQVEQFAPLLQSVTLPPITRVELKAAKPTKVLEEAARGHPRYLARRQRSDREHHSLWRADGADAHPRGGGDRGDRRFDGKARHRVARCQLVVAPRSCHLERAHLRGGSVCADRVQPHQTALDAGVSGAGRRHLCGARRPCRRWSRRAQHAPTHQARRAGATGCGNRCARWVSSVVVTVVGLVTLTLTTGSQNTLASLPSTAVLIGVGVSIAVLALALLVPRVRKFALAKVLPVVRQTWPRLSQVLG